MRCGDLMTTTLHVVREDDAVRECARLMRDHGVGFVPVVDGALRPVGVVTDRDLVARALAPGLPFDTPVSVVMTRGAVLCGPDEDLRQVGRRMSEARVGRIVVVDPDGGCIGVVSLADVARVEDCHQSGSMLRAIALRESKPPPAFG